MSASHLVSTVSLTLPVDHRNIYNNFLWPSDWIPWWNQTTTVSPNLAPASWPNQTPTTWPNQTPAPWPNQSSATWPNQTNTPLPNPCHHTCATPCSNGFPVSVTNNNYYPVCSPASTCVANVPLPVACPTVPVYCTPLVPTVPLTPVALPAVALPAAVCSAPSPAWNTLPITASPTTSSLHPMLCSTPVAYPHLSWSIERFVSTARICTQANAERALFDAEMAAQAVPPSISEIRIHVSALREWQRYWGPIVVRQYSTSQGIRNEDVLQGIFNYFQMPLTLVEINRLHHAYQDLVGWEAERRVRELPNGGVSSDVERNRGLLRIDLVGAAVGGVKFAGMQPVGGWNAGVFSLNITN